MDTVFAVRVDLVMLDGGVETVIYRSTTWDTKLVPMQELGARLRAEVESVAMAQPASA